MISLPLSPQIFAALADYRHHRPDLGNWGCLSILIDEWKDTIGAIDAPRSHQKRKLGKFIAQQQWHA